MEYALVGLLDSETEEQIKKLWKELSEMGISNYGEELRDRRPHITIADYTDPDKNILVNLLDKYYEDKNKIEISLGILGTFIGSGTLFISPVLTEELLNFNKSHHEFFNRFDNGYISQYSPGKWVPHVTIASRLDDKKIQEAFEHCSKNLKKLKAWINEVSLLEFREYSDSGICICAPSIFSKDLKDKEVK